MLRHLKWFKSVRRFGKARKGSAAVEFAIVAVPFFMLTFGLVEILMIGFAQTSLDFAVAEAGREVRTGRVQQNGVSAAEVQEALCDQVNRFMVLTCEGNLFLDVDRYDSFVAAANGTVNPIDEDGNFQTGGMGFTPGADSDIVVVRAYYRWEVMTPLFEPVFSNTAGGQRILVSTMMFRNEPFGPVAP
ncbi:MAG TPA: pilus assembly protein [Terricaulis sp.]|nr:pilus assembly protein [Terricaulis sp.]